MFFFKFGDLLKRTDQVVYIQLTRAAVQLEATFGQSTNQCMGEP